MTIVYFDLVSGASGDMILGSLVALGAPLAEIDAKLRDLPLSEFTLVEETVVRHGFDALRLRVEARETKTHRHYSEIRRMLKDGRLPNRVRQRSLDVFGRLARAEAAAHGIAVEEVHFHEVGAVDAVVDVVGTAWALELLGVDRCHASVVPQGRGLVRAEHGTIPVPAPATMRLLEGTAVQMTEIDAELTTPTGAALITGLCATVGEPVGMRVKRFGVASGSMDLPQRPNVLRAILAEPLNAPGIGAVDVLETTIDDMNPQLYGHLTEALFAGGALEVYLTPVQMKKGRPGVLVTALCDQARSSDVASRLFSESTTIGVRVRREGRIELRREIETVETPLGRVRVKRAVLPNGEERRAPEYEDARAIATSTGRPLVDILEELRAFLAEQRAGL